MLATFMIGTQAFSSENDVRDPQGNFIQVERSGDQISFQYCTAAEGCTRYLGPQKEYSVSNLIHQRNLENGKFVFSLLAMTAAVGSGGYVGVVVAGFAPAAVPLGQLIAGGAIGAAAGGKLTILARLNPFERYQIANTLDSDVLNDDDVNVKDVETFANNLEIALENSTN